MTAELKELKSLLAERLPSTSAATQKGSAAAYTAYSAGRAGTCYLLNKSPLCLSLVVVSCSTVLTAVLVLCLLTQLTSLASARPAVNLPRILPCILSAFSQSTIGRVKQGCLDALRRRRGGSA